MVALGPFMLIFAYTMRKYSVLLTPEWEKLSKQIINVYLLDYFPTPT